MEKPTRTINNSKLDAYGWMELQRKAPTDKMSFLFQTSQPMSPSDLKAIEAMGVTVHSVMGTIGTGVCNAEKLEEFSQMSIIERVEFSRPMYPNS